MAEKVFATANVFPDCPSEPSGAVGITRASSPQAYYTIRYLVDRELKPCAYQAYAYFRWVDDYLDNRDTTRIERLAFINRQKTLVEQLYRRQKVSRLSDEEQMLVELIQCDHENDSGLQSYIRNMMEVMSFDAGRRGRKISSRELVEYTRLLATAVTDALHYYIGSRQSVPAMNNRYYAAAAAHIIHMLRDTVEDVTDGYFNIPADFLESYSIAPHEIHSLAYQNWVRHRVELARRYFTAGKDYLARVANLRCRLAGYAYISHFENIMHAIESDGYTLRPVYQQAETAHQFFQVSASALFQALRFHRKRPSIYLVSAR